MKLYPPIEKELISSLSYLFHNKASSTQVVRYTFKKNRVWGSRDRRVYSEIFFDVIRFFGGFSKFLEKDLIHSSELADEDFEKIIKIYLDEQKWSKVKEQDLEGMAHRDLLFEIENSFKNQKFKEEYLENALIIPDVFLRVNLTKTNTEDLIKSLEADGLKIKKISESCLKLEERKNVLQLDSFKAGLFEVQDGASQEVAPFLEPIGASRIADTCAGAGGKSLHLSDLMKGKGRILALDISERRLEELKKRSKKASFQNIETRVIESSKTLKRLDKSFERVLIDAPCTGTGTFRRKPEGKIHFRKERLNELLETQKEVLSLHSKLVKPGGLLVYATCSILKCENDDQVNNFLKENDSFKLVESKTNMMGQKGFDGFFMAKLQRIND